VVFRSIPVTYGKTLDTTSVKRLAACKGHNVYSPGRCRVFSLIPSHLALRRPSFSEERRGFQRWEPMKTTVKLEGGRSLVIEPGKSSVKVTLQAGLIPLGTMILDAGRAGAVISGIEHAAEAAQIGPRVSQ
jgi:hypothetical protein